MSISALPMHRWVAAMILSYSAFTSLASSQAYSPLIMDGESYPNTCSPAEQKKLQDALLMSRIHDAVEAWRVINTILCGPDNETTRIFITTITPKKVRESVNSTGDRPSIKITERSQELVRDIIAGGRAWDANIRFKNDIITVHYFANEACVKRITLAYIDGKWAVYEVGEACD